MTDTIRVKRRVTGSPGAPASLANAELAYNEVNHTLYYGEGTGGSGGSASTIVPIGGTGAFLQISGGTLTGGLLFGNATFDGSLGLANRLTLYGSNYGINIPSAGNIGFLVNGSIVLTLNASGSTVAGGLTVTGGGLIALTGTTSLGTTLVSALTVSGGLTSTASTTSLGTTTITALTATAATGNAALAAADSSASFATTQWVRGFGVPIIGGTMTGPLLLPAGTVAAPGLQLGSAGTGIQGSVSAANIIANGSIGLAVTTTSNISYTPLNMQSNAITSLPTPVNPNDAANKSYVDNAIQGLNASPACKAATTANISLTGTQTVDGVALVVGDRCLVKNQTTGSQNGIYVVASAGWQRAFDMDTAAEVPAVFTWIEMGTVNADSGWLCTNDPPVVLNTDTITFVQFSGAGQITAGNGLTKAGNTISAVGTAARIAVGASIDIASTYVGQNSINTLGTVITGTWAAQTISTLYGGTGAVTPAVGYMRSSGGTSPYVSVATIPNTDITGLGTMSTQAANNVAITGGTIDNIVFDGGTF